MNKQKTILILYTSIGLGHKYIALNIGFHLEQAGFNVKYHDILKVQDGPFVKLGEWLHRLINVRFPFIWKWLYLSSVFAKLTMWMRVPVAGFNKDQLQNIIEELKPDMVISTQTSASAPMAYLKKHNLYTGLFVIAFSDYHFHPYWYYAEADFYLANIKEQAIALENLGVPQDKILVCGITLQPQESFNSEQIKNELKVSQYKNIILMSSGSLGIGFSKKLLLEYAQKLSEVPETFLIVSCGKNKQLKLELEEDLKAKNLPVLVLGFFEPFGKLYAITDVMLTKPGGLTVAEALRDRVKMLATHVLPGQEELNYNFLTHHNLIEPIPDPLTAENLVKQTSDLLYNTKAIDQEQVEQISQRNNEGTALVKSITEMFHSV